MKFSKFLRSKFSRLEFSQWIVCTERGVHRVHPTVHENSHQTERGYPVRKNKRATYYVRNCPQLISQLPDSYVQLQLSPLTKMWLHLRTSVLHCHFFHFLTRGSTLLLVLESCGNICTCFSWILRYCFRFDCGHVDIIVVYFISMF